MTGDRLSVVDDIFLRTHRGFGLPIVLQGIWRSEDAIDRVDIAAVHANLALGRLGRRVLKPRIPGSRRRWIPSTDTLPIEYSSATLAEGSVLEWADAQGEIDLDPEFGPGWRISVAATTTGGTVISLVCSHALADAAGLISAVGKAIEGSAPEPRSRRTSDIADAVALGTRVTVRSIRAAAGLVLSRDARRELAAFMRSSGAVQTHESYSSTAIFDVDAHLSNAEFISVVADIAFALGEPEPVSINIPFRSNTQGTNAIGMATIDVSGTDTVGAIRESAKAAFATPAGAPSGFPAEVVQLLPDARAAALTASPGTARVLCSNVGALPPSVMSIGGHPASSLATRAIHPGTGGAPTATALSAYLSTSGPTSTLSLVGTAASFAPILDSTASAVLERRGLRARSWNQGLP